ncbi:unnamed protein product [Prunus armeniaca]|uniref:Uncharacterized protein n=1 Tax=Prunus armeniaca TaxID=36596 RepID=A0A6J5U3H2_PRUAR|nr:hypothetical protein GBA52_007695 [Prunus armeniaca]CAB4269655.1 unnamed protein product [Prunus armeniaca]
MVVVGLWRLWKSRKKGVFEGTHVDPMETLQTFFAQCQECQEMLDSQAPQFGDLPGPPEEVHKV